MTQMAAQSDQGVVQGWNDWLARKGYDKTSGMPRCRTARATRPRSPA